MTSRVKRAAKVYFRNAPGKGRAVSISAQEAVTRMMQAQAEALERRRKLLLRARTQRAGTDTRRAAGQLAAQPHPLTDIDPQGKGMTAQRPMPSTVTWRRDDGSPRLPALITLRANRPNCTAR
jgi:hypothetical protein